MIKTFLRFMIYPLILLRRRIRYNRKNKIKKREEEKQFYINQIKNSVFDLIISGSVVTNLEKFKGKFELDIRSSILKRILFTKNYEFELINLIDKLIDINKDAIDVGSNIGLYTVYFAKKIAPQRKVLAIEPIPRIHSFLLRNIDLNNCSNKIITYKGIATNKKGEYKINTIDGLEEYSSIGNIVHPYAKGMNIDSILVNGETLNNLVSKNQLLPGFIKIDTEGAEYSVLSGATDIMGTYRPIILTEANEMFLKQQGSSWKELYELFNKYNYITLNAFDFSVIKNLNTVEVLAIPNEKFSELKRLLD